MSSVILILGDELENYNYGIELLHYKKICFKIFKCLV